MMHTAPSETRAAGKPFSRVLAAVLYSLILTMAVGANRVILAQAVDTHYAQMAPVAQYLDSDVEAETALARSAAPASISGDATVLVLKRSGYEVAQKGKNGFVCLVERAWMGPLDDAGFWNPKVRGAICFNPPAARSVLPITFKRTEFALARLTKTQMTARLMEAVARKEFPVLEAGSMSYMQAKGSYLGDAVVHWHPHLMFYAGRSDGSEWGADAENSPVFLNPQFQKAPERLTTYIVVVPKWSDGSPATSHDH